MFNKYVRSPRIMVAAFAMVAVVFMSTATAQALTTVPTLMNFQGRLTDNAGLAKADGTYNMKLSLYDAASAGTLRWSEDRLVSAGQGVVVVNGLFSIKLGEVTPLPANIFSSGSLYLQVELATPASATTTTPVWTEGPMTPRNPLATSAYSFNAELFDGMDSTAFMGYPLNNTMTGYNTFRPTTNSTTTFTIQNSTGQNLFNVDTTGTGAVTMLSGPMGSPGAWTTASNSLPGQRHGCGTVVANGYIYCIGGSSGISTSQKTVYYAKLNADGSVGTWSSLADMPAPRHGIHTGTIVANGYVYVLGGNSSSEGGAQSTVFYARLNSDGTLGAWGTTTSLLAPRYNAAAVVIGGYVYLFGGESGGGTVNSTVYFAKLHADGTIGAWQTATNSIGAGQPRATMGAVYANGYVYLPGGYDGATNPTTVYYAKVTPDGTVGSVGAWQTTSALPSAAVNNSVVVANGYLYSIGGNASTNVYYARINADGTVGAWSTSANSLPWVQHSAGRAVANGYAYHVGGYNTTTSTPVSTVLYARLGGTLQLGGSLDLVSLQGQTLADGGSLSTGSTGGSLTAGNITAVGTLQVQGQSLFNDSVSVARDFTVGNNLLAVDDNNAGTVTVLGNASGETSAWKSGAALSAAISGAASVSSNGYAYVIGGSVSGTAQNSIYYTKLNADGSVSNWQTTTSLPQPRVYSTSVIANGYIYVLTGRDGSAPQSTVYYAKLNADGSVGTWQTNSSVGLGARQTAQSIVSNGYVYVIGGWDGATGPQSTVYYAKLNADGSVGTWQTAANALPASGRDQHSSVIANGYVYVIGGTDNTPAIQSTVLYTKLNADGSVGTWQTAANSLPQPRRSLTTLVANGYIYALGGYNSGADQSTVYYAKLNADGSVDTWQSATNGLPSGRSDHASITANGYAYAIAGSNSSTVFYGRLGATVQIGGSLDLVGSQGGTLVDAGGGSTGSTGGSLTAGNITAAGALQVQGRASIVGGASVTNDFNAGNGIFSASSTATTVQVGSSALDATAVVLVLDTKTDAADPTGVNGAMYYNSNLKKFRCYQGGAWTNCTDGYTVSVRATTTNPSANTTYYFSNLLSGLNTTSTGKLYIRKSGTIKVAELFTRAEGTAGSGEAWSFYVRVNGTTDYLISSQSVAGAERIFSNATLNIPITEGNYVEIKTVTPAWATAPTQLVSGGYLYIE